MLFQRQRMAYDIVQLLVSYNICDLMQLTPPETQCVYEMILRAGTIGREKVLKSFFGTKVIFQDTGGFAMSTWKFFASWVLARPLLAAGQSVRCRGKDWKDCSTPSLKI